MVSVIMIINGSSAKIINATATGRYVMVNKDKFRPTKAHIQ
jgi:hypothetical protein